MQATSVITVITVMSFVVAASNSLELIFMSDPTTERTGSISLQCRDEITADTIETIYVQFFVNRSSAADPSLRERGDITVVEVGSTTINFNLTRRLDGNYTCGRRVDQCANFIIESRPIILICKEVY